MKWPRFGQPRLATQLALAMLALTFVTALCSAWAVGRTMRVVALPAELALEQGLTARLLAELDNSARQARADVLVEARAGRVDAVVAAHPAEPAAVAALERGFEAQLLAKPEYLQLRLLDASDGGRELVRVQRETAGGPVRRVRADELQQKGDRPYYTAASLLPAGDVYISPIELNQEWGKVQEPHVPVMRAAAPLYDLSGSLLGVVVLNVDMTSALDRLRRGGSAEDALYLLSERGDYIVHPDPEREFGVDLGRSSSFVKDFPDIGDPFASTAPLATERAADGPHTVLATASRALADGPRVAVVAITPFAGAAALDEARARSLLLAVLAALISSLAALFLARSVTRPLGEIVRAAERLPGPPLRLPTRGSAEITALSAALSRMDDALRAQREGLVRQGDRLARIFDAVPRALLLLDEQRRVIQANRGAASLFGVPVEALVGRPIDELVPHARLEADVTTTCAALLEDGATVPVDVRAVLVKDGASEEWLMSIVDQRERKRSEDTFRSIVEAAPNAKILVDHHGHISLANQATERLFGYAPGELLGLSVEILLPEVRATTDAGGSRPFYAEPSVRAMGPGRDVLGRRRDGGDVPLEMGHGPVETTNGLATIVSMIDVSVRRRVEDELRRSNAELEQFAHIASHDLQEPLRMVANYTELLAQRYRGRLDEKADRYIHHAVDGAKRMQMLVSDLLRYSRVASEGRPLARVDSDTLVREVVQSLAAAVADAGAVLEVDPLPVVLADDGQLRQVFQNLMANALKFRSDSTPVRIHVTATQEGARWRFSVQDNGIGVEMKYSKSVFKMFQRVHDRGQYQGSGIGLALAQRIVERHAGTIWLESEVGVGTTVHFTLPGVNDEAAP